MNNETQEFLRTLIKGASDHGRETHGCKLTIVGDDGDNDYIAVRITGSKTLDGPIWSIGRASLYPYSQRIERRFVELKPVNQINPITTITVSAVPRAIFALIHA